MGGVRSDGDYPADPYPGAVPGFSFVHLDAASHRLVPDPAARGGWACPGAGHVGLDDWLAAREAPPMAARVPVLAFGSNRCPSKLTWLREHLGLTGPVVVLRAEVSDLAAVWAAGCRARDGARPATLALAPGVRETHAVWMATPAQVAVLDVCEGRGERYQLVRLHASRVRTEDGAVLDDPWTYWPAGPARAPLLVDGAPVRCAEVDQAAARALVGEPAPLPPGATTPQDGPPDPEGWPPRVFVYGTLQPGRSAWSRVAPHAVGHPVPAWMPGRVHDTGRGYPALRPRGADGTVARAEGSLVTLADVARALPALDAYEGPAYRRVRAVAYPDAAGPGDGRRAAGPGDGRRTAGSPCWVWVWDAPLGDWPVVDGRWDRPG